MSIETDLQHFLMAEILPEDSGELTPDSALLSSGWVDSMGLLQVIGYIQQTYGVDLSATGEPRDFETIRGLAAAVRRQRGDR